MSFIIGVLVFFYLVGRFAEGYREGQLKQMERENIRLMNEKLKREREE